MNYGHLKVCTEEHLICVIAGGARYLADLKQVLNMCLGQCGAVFKNLKG